MSTERQVKKYVTPYQLIRLLNSRYGGNRPTQMGYNYVKNGYIPSVVVDNQRVIDVEVAELWLKEFATRNKLTLVTKK